MVHLYNGTCERMTCEEEHEDVTHIGHFSPGPFVVLRPVYDGDLKLITYIMSEDLDKCELKFNIDYSFMLQVV